jgi:poly-gamma-glutamate capsule biosynthesis protein CapA/YwtB (metallophosphatase superfamily)
VTYTSETGDLSIAFGGDCMLTRRLRVYSEPTFLALAELFRHCDAGFVNLETVVRRWDEGTPGITQGTYMTTPPEFLEDLKWFGITMVSCANTHAFDYGEGGILASIKHLNNANIVHAGAGRNLAEARMPAYLETPAGRVALISTSSSFYPWNKAGAQRPDMQGRPGINTFGFRSTYSVDRETFESLDRMTRELGLAQDRARNRAHFFSDSEIGPDDAAHVDVFGNDFVIGEQFGSTSEGNLQDIEENLRSIREARRQADWVVVSFHNHEYAHRSLVSAKSRVDLAEPADFVSSFARAAIDAGADVFAGHGSHTPLGIELYKGKPIFYSLGNFCFQNETVSFFPAEAYSRFELGHDATPADFQDARTANGTKGHVAHAGFWENAVFTCSFRSKKFDRIQIHPIEQGFGRSRGERGRPVLAGPEMGARIIERLDKLSQPYGTRVKNQDGIGIVTG